MFKLHVYFRTKNNENFTFDNVWILILDFPVQAHIRHIEFPTNTATFAFSIWITGFKIYFIKIPAFNLKYNFLLLHEPAFPIKIIQNLYICWSIFPSNHRLSRPFEHATKVCEVQQYQEMQHPSHPWVAKIVPIITWIWPLKGKCFRNFTLVQKCLYSTASETYCSLSAFKSNLLRASVSYDALSRIESIIT